MAEPSKKALQKRKERAVRKAKGLLRREYWGSAKQHQRLAEHLEDMKSAEDKGNA